MIYFAEAVGVGNIKIGFTDGPVESRIADLQTGCPVPIRLLGTAPGTLGDEKDLHRRFAAQRVHGEWFKPAPDLLALIGARPRECDGVSVAERSVTIRVLTVGRKQLTAALVKQLPLVKRAMNWGAAYIDWLQNGGECEIELDVYRDGDCWGWVQTADGRYLILEIDGRLCRFPDKWLSDHDLRAAVGLNPYDTTRAAQDANEQLRAFYASRVKYPGWRPEDQLFFGV